MLRTARRWSQERLGFDLGVGKATISKWENGLAEPSLGQLLAIRRLFEDEDVSLDYLIGASYALEPYGVAVTAEALAPVEDGQLSAEEQLLLACYRRLSSKQRRSLLGLLGN